MLGGETMLKKSLLIIVCVLATMLALVTCGKNKQTDSTPASVTLVSISVENQQTEFRFGEKFKFGGDVIANYSNGTKETLEYGYKINSDAYNKEVSGTYNITVTYGEKSFTYQVTVGQAPVTGLAVSDAKTEYAWGEEFVFEGVVSEVYSIGTSSVIDESKYTVDSSAYDKEIAGEYEIVVSYTQDPAIKTTYTVTVAGMAVNELVIEEYKQSYSVLEDFDINDVEGYYTLPNGDAVEMTAENTVVNLGDYKEFTLGSFNITLAYVDNADVNKTISINVVKPEKIRILFIGNSFSDDTTEYMPNILSNLGYQNVEIGNMFIGGCTIDTHYSNVVNNYNAYDFRYHNGKFWNKAVTGLKQSIKYAVEYKDWDIISLQQASGSSGMPNTYNKLDALATEVKKLTTNPRVKIVFNMTWAYRQDCQHPEFPNYGRNQMTMYNAIVNTVQTQVNYTALPCGTAIQNARTSFIGDNLNLSDGYHLNEYIGRYIAALTAVAKLLDDDLSNLTFRPENVSAAQMAVAVESAVNAVKNPFTVTESQHKTA